MDSSLPSNAALVSNEKTREDYETENDKTVRDVLIKKSSLFKELHELRKKGWECPELTAAYKAKEEKNRNPDDDWKNKLYGKMIKTGEELEEKLGEYPGNRLLDICFAPGGFSKVFLKDEGNTSCGISLLEEDHGLQRRLERNARFNSEMLDITLLADEYGENTLELSKIDVLKRAWNTARPFGKDTNGKDIKFPFVICDGHLERQGDDESEDEHQLKIHRLIVAQLMLALHRVENDGTLIIRLYNPDTWQSVKIIHQFSKFSNIELFRSKERHKSSSVVYLIAKNMRVKDAMAEEALEDWKRDWWTTMLGGRDGKGEMVTCVKEDEVRQVLEKFGIELIKLAKESWEMQYAGLEYDLKCVLQTRLAKYGGIGNYKINLLLKKKVDNLGIEELEKAISDAMAME